MNNHFAITGIVIGAIAIIIAVFQLDIVNFIEPPVEKSTFEKMIDKGKDLLSEETAVYEAPALKNVRYLYMIIGSIGILFSIASFTKKEEVRMSAIAAATSTIAVSWAYVMVGIILAVIIVLFYILASVLG